LATAPTLVEPQYEYLEQQSPYAEPAQLNPPVAPLAFPQRPSLVTLTEDEGEATATEADERVEVWRVEEAGLDEAWLSHFPKTLLQPFPQYAEDLPQ
jgi:hypothetical protein